MALTDKYRSLIEMAARGGVADLRVAEDNGVLHVTGTAPSEEVKRRLWDEYNRTDPDMRSADLVLNVEVGGGGGAGQTYTVKSGDTLSEIGQQHGVPWRAIFEANRDQLKDPDKIYPGQSLRIPRE